MESFSRSGGSIVQIGLLALFTQCGSVVYDHFEDDAGRSGLDARLTHWQPAEIVVSDGPISTPTLNYVKMVNPFVK